MAHKKGPRLEPERPRQQLATAGVKVYGGTFVPPARSSSVEGTRYVPGRTSAKGKDDTLFALVSGRVGFAVTGTGGARHRRARGSSAEAGQS